MSISSDPDDYIVWLPALLPAVHVYDWLRTAPWGTIDLKLNGASASLERIASTVLHAIASSSPSPLLVSAMVLWVIVLGAHFVLRPRRSAPQ